MKSRYGHFNWIAPFYDRIFGGMSHDQLLTHLSLNSGQHVLDVGGGTGRVAQYLHAHKTKVFVLDPSPKMLLQAVNKEIIAVRGIAEQLPFSANSIDRIFVVDAFHHFANQKQAATELVRVLRVGGRIVVEEPDLRHFAVKCVAMAEKLALMQSHFYDPPALAYLFESAGATVIDITKKGFSAHIVVAKE